MKDPSALPRGLWHRLDSLVLVVLVLARLRIDTLAEAAVLPLRQADVARHPWLSHLLTPRAMALLAEQQLVDPIALLLVVLTVAGLVAHLLVDELVRPGRAQHLTKLALIWAIVLLAVCAPSAKLILLRQASGPASYSHDGGVIQTEAAITFLLSGRNPYVEDYLDTPMAEWGISQFRTALYHYPYLPWTFLFSAPFRLAAERLWGWYDQRFVYLLLFLLMLLLVPGLVREPKAKRLSVMLLGLNPIMGSDLIYGQNDSFVLAWIVISAWLWARGLGSPQRRRWLAASAAVFGLACASKPTAWFLAPFYVLLVADGGMTELRRAPGRWLKGALLAVSPGLVTFALVTLPYLLWDAGALFDDTWRWASGTSSTAYQIWGWGASNLLLALGWVADRFSYWPFWLPQLVFAAPLLAVLLWRQASNNTLRRAFWGYGLFLAVFFFFSRFFNENYLGYILGLLILGAVTDVEGPESHTLAGE